MRRLFWVISVGRVRQIELGKTSEYVRRCETLSCSTALRHMAGFIDYVAKLENMALTGHVAPKLQYAPALDGEAGRELRRLVALSVRRDYGAFFTGSKLAERVADRVPKCETYWDPSCGAGDLLLAAARKLPIRPTLHMTIELWSQRLGGYDIHAEFVRATKARLVLLARSRGVFTEPYPAEALAASFPAIEVADALAIPNHSLTTRGILMNPPYFAREAPATCRWGTGRINVAALFVEDFLSRARPGANLIAIVPEVLRSGTNYRRWRKLIAEMSEKLKTKSVGLFDANADVDVFLLTITKKRENSNAVDGWPKSSLKGTRLDEQFEVSVGAVVPHRDMKNGSLRRFIDAKTAPSCGVVHRVKERRRFNGPVVKPPFVTIKRTSRPGDRLRAVPTLIKGTQPVAVENHLIVCRPKDGRLTSCVRLHRQLQAPTVSDWLNKTMRCRHLTVGAVKLIRLPV